MRNISQRTLAEVPAPIAPSEDQATRLEEIGLQLAYADRLRVQVQRTIESAKALRRSLFLSAFTGKLVPQDPDDKSALAMLKPIPAPASPIAPIPSGIQEELPL